MKFDYLNPESIATGEDVKTPTEGPAEPISHESDLKLFLKFAHQQPGHVPSAISATQSKAAVQTLGKAYGPDFGNGLLCLDDDRSTIFKYAQFLNVLGAKDAHDVAIANKTSKPGFANSDPSVISPSTLISQAGLCKSISDRLRNVWDYNYVYASFSFYPF